MPGYQTPITFPATLPGDAGNFKAARSGSQAFGIANEKIEGQTGLFPAVSVRVPIPISARLTGFTTDINFNNLDANTVIDILINGVSWGGGTLTYIAAEAGIKSVIGASVAVVSGDLISLLWDTTLGTVGSIFDFTGNLQYQT